MNINFGKGKTEYGPGVEINLTGKEIAMAIYAYLMAHNTIIDGATTITINNEMIKFGEINVDPSGRVIFDGIGWSGRGYKE